MEKYDAGKWADLEGDWIDGGVTFTKAWASDIRDASCGKGKSDNIDINYHGVDQ